LAGVLLAQLGAWAAYSLFANEALVAPAGWVREAQPIKTYIDDAWMANTN